MLASGRVVATVVAVVVGLLILADIFVSKWPINTNSPGVFTATLSNVSQLLISWLAIVAAFALILGLLNIFKVHFYRVQTQQPGAIYSVVLLVSLVGTLLAGLFGGPNATPTRFIFHYILTPLEATFFSLLAIFMATAAFRAFRIHNLESFFFVLFAVIVLLGQVPLGIYLWGELPIIKDWILNVPTLAGVRGILLGVALGTIATGLRVLLSADRPYTD